MMKRSKVSVWGWVAVVAGFLGGEWGGMRSEAWGQTVRVEVGEELKAGLAGKKGRVVVFLIAPGAKVRGGDRVQPKDGFFEENPQPIFGVEVADWGKVEGGAVVVGPETEGFVGEAGGKEVARGKMKALPAGKYRVQAAWIASEGGFGDVGSWEETAGNMYSEVVVGELGEGKEVVVRLTEVTEGREFPAGVAGVEEFVLRSELLSKFYGRDFYLRAGVRMPGKVEAGKKYPAVYEVPGFGGDHRGAIRGGVGRGTPEAAAMREGAFYIVLDPSSPTGHSLFLDSDNNGPWGKALTEELIPALEAKYPLVAKKEGRLLRGHSSGGWSTLWLTTEYPEVFGACWSSSPDPVDFRKFELVDIYARENHYEEGGKETPSARMGGKEPTMTVRQENAMEDVLGPGLTSAQQWTSWQACWGRRAEGTGGVAGKGGIRPLYDVVTGKLDREEAESYRRFDIAERLRKDPKRFVPIFRNQVRLMVGTRDDYYLEQAVELLAADLERLDAKGAVEGGGYIRFVPMTTHSTIFGSAEMRKVPGEMVAYLKKAGLMGE